MTLLTRSWHWAYWAWQRLSRPFRLSWVLLWVFQSSLHYWDFLSSSTLDVGEILPPVGHVWCLPLPPLLGSPCPSSLSYAGHTALPCWAHCIFCARSTRTSFTPTNSGIHVDLMVAATPLLSPAPSEQLASLSSPCRLLKQESGISSLDLRGNRDTYQSSHLSSILKSSLLI